jgi:hypothetical protein
MQYLSNFNPSCSQRLESRKDRSQLVTFKSSRSYILILIIRRKNLYLEAETLPLQHVFLQSTKSKKIKKKTVSLASPENTPLKFQIP